MNVLYPTAITTGAGIEVEPLWLDMVRARDLGSVERRYHPWRPVVFTVPTGQPT